MASLRPLFVVAGVGNASGTGAAAARLFSRAGYSVALIARGEDSLKNLSKELNDAGGDTAPIPVQTYEPKDIKQAFSTISARFPKTDYAMRAALFNVGYGIWKPFLQITQEELKECLDTNIVASFAFSQEVIPKFLENGVEGKKGTLIFTGATASMRGNVTTSAFAAAKHGMRGLSQSLAKEFGKEGIHVAHAIIDGVIGTGTAISQGKVQEARALNPEAIAQAYMNLVNQDPSALTWELDLRPSNEKW